MVAKTVLQAVTTLLESLDLDATGEAHAAIAGALAERLDASSGANSGAQTAACAGIAKELRATIATLTAKVGDANDFVADLFDA